MVSGYRVGGYRKWIYALKIISDKLSSIGQFGHRNTRYLSYCKNFGPLGMQRFKQCCVQHANGWTLVKQCFFKLSNMWTVMCPTVQWLVLLCSTVQWPVRWVSNSPMVWMWFFQLSNGRTVVCATFQGSDNAASNCPMVGQCCVQQSNG